MSKELFLKVRSLSQKKHKNEEAVPMEVLQTKYKIPYENLCNELKESQKQLRLEYMESIRAVTELISDSVYIDFGNDDFWNEIVQKYSALYNNSNTLTKELIKAFLLTINSYLKD